MTRILVLFVIVILAVTPIGGTYHLCVIILNDLPSINILEVVVVVHGDVRSRVKLAQTLHGLIVVLLAVVATNSPLDRIDFMIIFTRPLALEVITVVSALVLVFSVISIIIARMVVVIVDGT
jgi:hypothetical protein